MWLFIAFLLIPLIEIGLFIQVGGLIGLWPTLLIVVLTAIAGTVLVRRQGLATLGRLQASLERAENPTGPIAHGALILFAGALLLTPGFFTDATGFALLIPAVRTALIRYGAARLAGNFTIVTNRRQEYAPRDDAPIDADYVELEPDDDPRRGDSGWTKRG